MIYTRIGLGLLALILVGLIILAITSAPGLRAPLIALAALALLVAGGNWLNHTLGIERKPQEFQQPDRDNEES